MAAGAAGTAVVPASQISNSEEELFVGVGGTAGVSATATAAIALDTYPIYRATRKCAVDYVDARWDTAGGSSNTLDIVVADSGTAVGSAVSILSAALDSTQTAGVVYRIGAAGTTPTLHLASGVPDRNIMNPGDTLYIKLATGTGPKGLSVAVRVRRLPV